MGDHSAPLDSAGSCRRFLTFSRRIAALPHLQAQLGAPVLQHRRSGSPAPGDGVIGWGLKPSADQAREFADRHALPFLRLEDGFLRSVELGNAAPPLSVVCDDLGIYYDAKAPSRLEQLIATPRTAAEHARARRLAAAWRDGQLSKYNHARNCREELAEPFVLAVDQTFGDASIGHGLADPAAFARMLAAALAENPDCTVLLKIHPEAVCGRKRGHFQLASVRANPRVRVLADDVHPATLLARARAVYTVTSQLGFEGLLHGKPVRTFGMPFYAGWGLTTDEMPPPARRRPVPLEELVHAALVDYPRYVDPETGERCEPEQLFAWLALQRRLRERFPPQLYACGFSAMKRPLVRSFLQGSRVTFVGRPGQLPVNAAVAVWGVPTTTFPNASTLLRLEDGFLRSVGLGADFIRPLSWAIDRGGLYYDATRPGDLQELLQHGEFDAGLLERARQLREMICRHGLTKYNLADQAGWRRREGVARIILVPGQVESDASIRYGTEIIRSNLQLLQAARAAHPDAWLLYKPHPDVVAGLRAKGAQEDACREYCDEIVTTAAMGQLLEEIDELHVMTSLAGFEALLRGKRVVTYGRPFYAGWGLTVDRLPLPARTRRLTLDQLVAGTLIVYPTYISRATGYFTTPENALRELLAWRARPRPLALWQRGWRLLSRLTGRP